MVYDELLLQVVTTVGLLLVARFDDDLGVVLPGLDEDMVLVVRLVGVEVLVNDKSPELSRRGVQGGLAIAADANADNAGAMADERPITLKGLGLDLLRSTGLGLVPLRGLRDGITSPDLLRGTADSFLRRGDSKTSPAAVAVTCEASPF
jgi:hypothetical protein